MSLILFFNLQTQDLSTLLVTIKRLATIVVIKEWDGLAEIGL